MATKDLISDFLEVLKKMDERGIESFKLPVVKCPNFDVKEFIKQIENKNNND